MGQEKIEEVRIEQKVGCGKLPKILLNTKMYKGSCMQSKQKYLLKIKGVVSFSRTPGTYSDILG